MGKFDGKVALVTGAGSGLGEATSKELAARGAKVILADLKLDEAKRVAKAIQDAGGEATATEMDASTRKGNEDAVQFAVKTYGALHLAVNNAGINGPGAKVGEMDLDRWDRVIQLNLNGVAYGMHYQIKQFLEQDKPSDCAIVNLSSIHGEVAILDHSAYTAAKHGVRGLTKNAGAEYGAQGIRVNAVGPAYIKTPLVGTLPQEVQDQLVGRHPLGRLGEPPEVAHLICFLLSDDASFITGSYHLIDGGYTAL